MSVFISAMVLGLAWFAAVNAVVSAIAWTLALSIGARIDPDARRSRRMLALRLLPFAAATAVSVALFVPAHLQLEPARTDERYGILLVALSAAGLVLFGRSLVRFVTAILASRRLLAAAREGVGRNAGRCTELPFVHGIALVGILRGRVIIGPRTRQILTTAELDVAVAHELAHRDALDNLTRLLIFCLPDFFGFTTAARRLERIWDAQAECLADARAVNGNPDRAVRLASALVKVARAQRPETSGTMAWSMFHRAALLEIRVRHLVGGDRSSVRSNHRRSPLVLGAATAIWVAWTMGLPSALHHVTELLVARLP